MFVMSSELRDRIKEILLQDNEADTVPDHPEHSMFDDLGNMYCRHNCQCMKQNRMACDLSHSSLAG